MTAIYIASFITVDDYEILVHDGDIREYDMSEVAQGFIVAAGFDRDRVLNRAKEAFVGEWNDLADDEPARTVDQFDFTWEDTGETETCLSVHLEGEKVGVIVISQREDA